MNLTMLPTVQLQPVLQQRRLRLTGTQPSLLDSTSRACVPLAVVPRRQLTATRPSRHSASLQSCGALINDPVAAAASRRRPASGRFLITTRIRPTGWVMCAPGQTGLIRSLAS